MRLGYLGKSDLSSVNGHSSQSQSATTSEFPKPSIGGEFERTEMKLMTIKFNGLFFQTDIPVASQNQFAWMQSGELHMTMGKSSNAASVPLDTRYGFFEISSVFSLRIHIFEDTKPYKMHSIQCISLSFCRNHNQEEVEVMSTDSSSTSSSDSQ